MAGAQSLSTECLVEIRNAAGAVIIRGEAPQHRIVLAAHVATEVAGVVRASLCADAATQGTRRFCRDDIDDSANRLAAIQGRLRAAENLDPGNIPGQQVGEVECAGKV